MITSRDIFKILAVALICLTIYRTAQLFAPDPEEYCAVEDTAFFFEDRRY